MNASMYSRVVAILSGSVALFLPEPGDERARGWRPGYLYCGRSIVEVDEWWRRATEMEAEAEEHEGLMCSERGSLGPEPDLGRSRWCYCLEVGFPNSQVVSSSREGDLSPLRGWEEGATMCPVCWRCSGGLWVVGLRAACSTTARHQLGPMVSTRHSLLRVKPCIRLTGFSIRVESRKDSMNQSVT